MKTPAATADARTFAPARVHAVSPLRWSHAGFLALPVVAWWFARDAAPWVTMWVVAMAEYLTTKILTLAGHWRAAPLWRVFAYLTLWPGLDAPAFLGTRALPKTETPAIGEWVFAGAKFLGGFFAMLWAMRHVRTSPALLVAWIGMLGIIFFLHFGFFHLVSLAWRRCGVAAPPLMRAPIAASSLAEFWGERWNVAFADAARRFLGRPLARKWGAAKTSGFVFLVSGLVHESVISLPARGGWGGPTLYFILQGGGAWCEKSAAGRALGLGRGWRGWTWTFLVTALPVPLLFHTAFATRVIVPFFASLAELLP